MDYFDERTHLWLFCILYQVFHQLTFKFFINYFLEHRDLTKVIAAKLLTNFTFVIQRISKRKFLIIFCYTEVLFPRHPESNRAYLFMEKAVQSIQKISFQKYSGKTFEEDKWSSPKSKQYFRKNIPVMKLVLFSVMLSSSSVSSVFSSIARLLLLCKRSNAA